MASKSIGSLYIDIEARTAKMEQDLERVKQRMGDTEKSAASMGNAWNSSQLEGKVGKFALGLVGIRAIATGLAHDFRDVVEHIEKIPNISPSVLHSVQELRHNINQGKVEIQQASAALASWFANAGKGIGGAAGVFVKGMSGQRDEGIENFRGLFNGEQTLTPDELARDQNPNYDKDLEAAKKRLADAREKAAMATADEVTQITRLHAIAVEEHKQAEDMNKSLLDRTRLMTESIDAETQASERHLKLVKELQDAEARVNKTTDVGVRAHLSYSEQLRILKDRVWDLRGKLSELPSDPGHVDDSTTQRKIELNKKLTDAQEQLNRTLAKQKDLYVELGGTLAEDFGNAIRNGETYNQLLHKIGNTIVDELIKRMIVAPLAGAFTNGLSYLGGMFGMVGAHAAGGPVNGPTMVGELGKELFIPPSGGGTIIPNNQLASAGGGGGSSFNFTYHISDGVSRSELLPILKAQEQHTIAAVEEARRRRKMS